MKTSELIGAALDWAVAKCESLCLGNDIFGLKPIIAAPIFVKKYKPSTEWAQGGPIIEREFITLRTNACVAGHWSAFIDFGGSNTNIKARQSGPTPLIAAMRCYCCAKLGDEIDIPQELQPCQQPNL